MRVNFVRDGRILQFHANHVAAGSFAAFANRVCNFAGFAEAHTHAAFLVTNHDERAEIETATAFDDLRGTVDEDDFLDQLFSALRVVIDFGLRTTTTTRTATAAASTAVTTLLLRCGSRLLGGRLPFRSAAR
jgi:hypothetical protein